MLIPDIQQACLMGPKVTNDSADLVPPEANIYGDRKVVEPKLSFHIPAANVKMSGLGAVG
jgi:hypothetical protein